MMVPAGSILMVIGAASGSGSGSPAEVLAIAIGLLGLGLGIAALWRGRRHDRPGGIMSTDGLTGLRDRRSFNRDVESHADRGAQPTAMLMIDIDHFRSFNDTHGHAAGDEVLRTVGATLERQVRKGDIAYRYGGEEFCVLLPGTDETTAAVVAERIRRTIETAHLTLDAKVTISVGVASGPADQITSVIGRADEALDDAKDTGRNRICIG